MSNLRIENNKSLQSSNTFGFNVMAEQYMAIERTQQLTELFESQAFSTQRWGILGGGSNITFTQDFQGLLLHNQIKGRTLLEQHQDHVLLEFGGGENWHETVLYTLENGWGGLENLSLIPGTVGASPIQNIGAYGVEIKDCFHSLTAFHIPTGEFHTINKEDCAFGYRDSVFKREKKGQYFITSVRFTLSTQPVIKTQYGDIQATLDGWGISQPDIRDISKAVIHIRQSKLPNPAEIGNCGSFFKNPVVDSRIIPALQEKYPDLKTFPAGEGLTKVPAGWLIEKGGWKGFKRGAIGVHAKQALVLVNYGGGTGAEIIALAKEIQADILQKFGIELEMEVNAW
jgi:UDP-N-acetylmuramate dehydrogenase